MTDGSDGEPNRPPVVPKGHPVNTWPFPLPAMPAQPFPMNPLPPPPALTTPLPPMPTLMTPLPRMPVMTPFPPMPAGPASQWHFPSSAFNPVFGLFTGGGLDPGVAEPEPELEVIEQDDDGRGDVDDKSWNDESWNDESWNDESWNDESWNDESWNDESWNDKSWNDKSWNDESWNDESWNDESWNDESWNDESWMVDKSWVLNSYWHDDDWAKWKIEETDEDDWGKWKAQEIQDISDEEEIEVESKKPVILQIKPKKRPSPPTIQPPAHLVETHAKSVPEMMQDQLPPEPPTAVVPPPKKRKATMGVGDPLPPGRIEPEPRVPRTIPPRVSSCSWMETDGATEVRATWSVRRFGDRDREIEEQEKEQGNETM